MDLHLSHTSNDWDLAGSGHRHWRTMTPQSGQTTMKWLIYFTSRVGTTSSVWSTRLMQ